MVPGFAPTGITIVDYWNLYSRSRSKIVDNRSVTSGCDATTFAKLFNAGSIH